MSDPRDICLLADEHLSQWQIDALQNTVESADVDISLVVINKPEEVTKKSDLKGADDSLNEPQSVSMTDVKLFFDMLREEGAWAFVLAEQKLAWLVCGPDRRWEHMQSTPTTEVDLLQDAEIIECTPISDGAWNELPDEVNKKIADQSDLAIRFGFGLIRGDVLTAPECGVLSFHPADIRKYRGQGPERIFLNQDDTGGITLQRLNDKIDSGEVVAFDTTDMEDAQTLNEVWANIHETQIELLAEGVNNLKNPGFSPTIPDDLGEYYSHEQHQELSFVSKILLLDLCGRIWNNF